MIICLLVSILMMMFLFVTLSKILFQTKMFLSMFFWHLVFFTYLLYCHAQFLAFYDFLQCSVPFPPGHNYFVFTSLEIWSFGDIFWQRYTCSYTYSSFCPFMVRSIGTELVITLTLFALISCPASLLLSTRVCFIDSSICRFSNMTRSSVNLRWFSCVRFVISPRCSDFDFLKIYSRTAVKSLGHLANISIHNSPLDAAYFLCKSFW